MSETGALVAIILDAAVRAGTPLLLATAGEILAQRSGIVNLGLEGAMLMGAMAAAWIGVVTGNLPAAMGAALLAGALVGIIHAASVVGAGVSMLASGVCAFFVGKGLSALLGAPIAGQPIPALPSVPLPLLADLPVIGQGLFRHDMLVYIAACLACGLWWVLFRSRLGLLIRATGENARTAREVGVPVTVIRIGTIVAGAGLAGLGGAHIALGFAHTWIEGLTAGRGWIAVGLVVLTRWNPIMSLPVAYLFGGIMAIQLEAQAMGINLSPYLLSMVPYLAAMVGLAGAHLWVKRSGMPAELTRIES